MKPVHYQVGHKNPHHGFAIAEGFNARAVPSQVARLHPGALHLIGGLQYGSLELLQQARAAGEPYVFFDRAYFGGGPGTDVLRVVPGAYQHHWLTEGAPECADRKVEIRPWRRSGTHILVVPPSSAIEQLFRTGAFWRQMPARLSKITRRPVRVSVKGDPMPLSRRLHDCWAVVTWTSNVAVEAVCAGIPVFCWREAAAAPMGNPLDTLERRLEDPAMPEGREAWAVGLLAGQFTVAQIAAGAAAAYVQKHFAELLPQ